MYYVIYYVNLNLFLYMQNINIQEEPRTRSNKKLYILIPIDLLKLKKNNYSYRFDKFLFLNYLLIITASLLYIYLIIQFLTTKYTSTILKTFHLFIILFTTGFLVVVNTIR